MFISFANRMSSFFPTESGKDVVLFLCVCRVVCFCLCKSVFWNEEPTASTQDVPVYITKLKCNMCEVGWFNCEMPERLPFTGLTGEQPQVQTSCHRSHSSAGLRAASHRTGGDFLELMSDRMHILPPALTHTFIYTSPVGQVLLFHPVHTASEHVMNEFAQSYVRWLAPIGKCDKLFMNVGWK